VEASELDRLLQILARLPGLGQRSARRILLHLLKRRESLLKPLQRALAAVDESLVDCSVCFNLDTQDPCRICSDPKRDSSVICIVESVADLWAMERMGLFSGIYHVLGGHLSALDGVRPEDLSIAPLIARARGLKGQGPKDQGPKDSPGLREVILALNATLEGQITARYIAEQLTDDDITISQLAHGVPVGGELDFLDDGTLGQALQDRRPLEN